MHRDAVLETPAGTENLGHSPSCGIQGFYRPCRFLTFQAHPEFDEEIMTEVVHARFRQGVFDQALYEDALSRVGNSHDGDLVSGLMLQFLVDCAQVNAG